jgi:hypothetical protein
MLWRYLLAIASWESLLERVDEVFGSQASDSVARLGSTDDGQDGSQLDLASEVVMSALSDRGFAAFAASRFAGPQNLQDLSTRARGSVESTDPGTYSDHVDFITDLLVQETELGDLALLPGLLTEDRCKTPHMASLARVAGGKDIQNPPANALAALLEPITNRRSVIRNALSDSLQLDPTLDALVSYRFLPYAESRFLITTPDRPRDSRVDSYPLSVLHHDYGIRRSRVTSLNWEAFAEDSRAVAICRNVAESLGRVSVPFMYWCAKSGLDVRRLWMEEESNDLGIWPLHRFRGYQTGYVAISSRVDGRSFAPAMRFLLKARIANPEATCLLVTDHWNEGTAAAIYEAASQRGSARPIAVLRSDGPQYAPYLFNVPTK